MSSELSWCYCCTCPGPCTCLSPRKAKDDKQFINELDRIKWADDTRHSSDHHTCLALALKGLITSDQLESLAFYLRNQGCIDAFSSDDGEFGRKNKFLDIWSELERKGKIGPGDYDLLERGLRSVQALGHIQVIKEFHAKIQNEDGPDEGCIIDKKVVKDCEHLEELTDLYKPLLENGSSGVIFKNAAISLVGDEGGEVKMTNGSVTLEVPPGAVQTETVFSAFFSPNDDDPEFLLAPANGPTLSESDGIVKYSLPVRLGPSNIEFRSPVLLTVRDFSLPKESVKRMGVYRKTDEDSTWRSVGSCFYDKDCINNLTARILLNSFSIYVLGLPVLSCLLPLNVHVMVEQLTGTHLKVFFTLNDYSYNEEFVFEKKINVDCATCLYIDPSRDVDVIWIRRVVEGLSKKVGTVQASEKVVLQNDRIQNLAETAVFVSIPEPALETNSNYEDVLILRQNEEEGPLVELSFNRSPLTPSETDLHATTEKKGADTHPECSIDGDEKQVSPKTRREIGSLHSHEDKSIEEDQNSAQHATAEFAGTLEANTRPTMTDDGSEEQRQHYVYDLPSEVGSLSSEDDDSIEEDPDSLAEMAGTLPYSEEDIDNLTSIFDAMFFCDDELIDFGDDLETLEEFKELLRKKLYSRVLTKHKNKRKKQFGHFMKTHEKLRRHLGCVYEDLEKFFQREECTENVVRLFDEIVPSCRSEVVRNFERLREERRVLVVGESGAGKSSLLNLLVGSPILPIDHTFRCTSTIYELVQSDPRDAYVERFGSDQRLLERISYEAENPKLVQKKLARVTNDTSMMCDLIRIHWPTKVLPGNIILVDSPGLGESVPSDEKVTSYLPGADAVIVVINACMGRSALDRLGSLLHSLERQENRPEVKVLNPRSILFILNKMDQVPEEVRSEFREDSIKRLMQLWPGIDGEKQVLSMSVLQAQRILDLAQGETAEYGNLVDAFYSLVETCLSTTNNYHKRWLSYAHGRLRGILQSMLINERRMKDERTEMKKRLQEALQQLQRFPDQGMIELEDNIWRKVNEIASALMAHLADETTVERLAEQCLLADQLNKPPELKEDNRLRCQSLIYQAATQEIIAWESRTQMIKKARSSLIDELRKNIHMVDTLTGAYIEIPIPTPVLPTADITLFPVVDKMATGKLTWFLRKLTGRDSREFREYELNRRQYMLKLTRETMASLTHDNIKKQIMQTDPIEYFKEQVPLLRNDIFKLLKEIEADAELTSGDTELGYDTLLKLLDASFNHLHYIELRYPEPIEADFYTASEVIMEEVLARGSLGVVHFASVVLKGEQNPTRIAARMVGRLTVPTANELVHERDTLRYLTHENIVKYIGFSIIQDTFVFLMELCKCSLSDLIFGHKVQVPGKQDEQVGFLQAFRDMVDRALQISNGLAFIHSNNLVHGALTMSKILVTDVGVLKLCGMKQRGVEGPITRSHLYHSPEILCGGMPTAQADIYSLGVVMYELWFGFVTYRDVFASGLEIDSIFEDIRRGDRKPMFEVEGYRRPVPVWCQLLEKCWKNTPSERISSRDIHNKLGTMLSEEYLDKMWQNVSA